MARGKKVVARIKMKIPAGKATPAPPVGSTLGQYGLNMMEFINAFNEQTKEYGEAIIPVKLNVYEDRTFDFKAGAPTTVYLIKQAAKVEKGSGEPNKSKVAKLSWQQVAEIAEVKMADLNALDLEAAKRVVAGTARSMGIEVK
ncbi:50S ribosomal protein L11 [Candidatus Microgenomates bacterium]|nr:50S ribosomal protein L11 [Candidatus Microgenomates bacterium]